MATCVYSAGKVWDMFVHYTLKDNLRNENRKKSLEQGTMEGPSISSETHKNK